tara:strand:- start:232 stop:366 length:135 start_codon:yes stop_codon:yes gene_type:complete
MRKKTGKRLEEGLIKSKLKKWSKKLLIIFKGSKMKRKRKNGTNK